MIEVFIVIEIVYYHINLKVITFISSMSFAYKIYSALMHWNTHMRAVNFEPPQTLEVCFCVCLLILKISIERTVIAE